MLSIGVEAVLEGLLLEVYEGSWGFPGTKGLGLDFWWVVTLV